VIILYGLGNNEDKYLNTKHNIGRRILEEVAGKVASSFGKNKTYYYTKSELTGDSIYFLYSSGYMNESGRALVDFCRYTNIDPDTKLLIIHDDSDQIEGSIKLLPKGGSAGHHGINSIYRELLATQLTIDNIWRLKVGIRPPENTLKSETFVLKSLSKTDQMTIQKTSDQLTGALPILATNQWEEVQKTMNTKKPD